MSIDERTRAHGSVATGFEPVSDVFTAVLGEQCGTGAAAAAWRDGKWIVDLWGGTGAADGSRLWMQDSIVQPYSVSKPFAAMCALLLIDRGLVDLDAPMQRYWPEFTTPAAVRHVLSHQAGIVAIDTPVDTAAFYDWDRLCALLAAQQPAWPPGTAHGESALFYGHLVGEIVRRVDGRTLGTFLREELCEPAGLDFIVGLTLAEQERAVDLTCLENIEPASTSDLYKRATTNPPGNRDPHVVNSTAWRAAEIPAINGHGSARGIAGLYAALLSGELLSPMLLREATSVQCKGIDAVFGHENAWGLGFGIDGEGFGMGGLGGSYGGACTRDGAHYAFAFVTGTMGSHARGERVENALRGCLGLPPL
ncbi:MAG TPA: serine hydrolase domain-containing protein [Candidatus Dormibacteraeota bacterium]